MNNHESTPLVCLFACIGFGFLVAALCVDVRLVIGALVFFVIAGFFEPDYPSGL